jgi:hypothetical protein
MLLSRITVALLALVAPASSALVRADDGPLHPHMHHAVHELRETRTELKEAAHDFGGHKEKALKAVDAALVQMEAALKDGRDPFRPVKVDADEYKKFEFHPHLHRAIHELKEARVELKEAKHDFGGHRERAIKDVDYAIEQLELALKYDRK